MKKKKTNKYILYSFDKKNIKKRRITTKEMIAKQMGEINDI
jgi:hypothetical protein